MRGGHGLTQTDADQAAASHAHRTGAVDAPPAETAFVLRHHRTGDLGWSFERQAVLYREEFSYAPAFETYLAQSLAPFLERFDPSRDAMWVAEQDGRRVGCVAIQHVAQRPGWAQLRWFFVEKEARGIGLGRHLIETALGFARASGYQGVLLWTVDDLVAARRVYEAAGFRLVEQTSGRAWASWGREQRWEVVL